MYSASRNDWTIRPSDAEIDGYLHMFRQFERFLGAEA
jgi:hypothetical protein